MTDWATSDTATFTPVTVSKRCGCQLSGTGFKRAGIPASLSRIRIAPETNNGIAVDHDYLKRRSGVVHRLRQSGDFKALQLRLRVSDRGVCGVQSRRVRCETNTLFDASWSHAVGSWAGTFRGSLILRTSPAAIPTTGRPACSNCFRRLRRPGQRSHWVECRGAISRRFGTRHQITTGVGIVSTRSGRSSAICWAPYELLWHDSRQSNTAGALRAGPVFVTDRLLLNVGSPGPLPRVQDPLRARLPPSTNPAPEHHGQD